VTDAIVPGLFVAADKILIGTVLLSIISALLARRGLPRLVSRRDRGGVAVVCGVIAAMYVGIAGFLAMAADNHLRVADVPQVRTRAEFIDRRDAGPTPDGLLLQASISESSPASADGVVATTGRLPDRYLLDLPGGPPVIAEGITSKGQAWAWPRDGSGERVLHRGDPVVVWGSLRKGMGAGGPTSATGLSEVRMVAAGDITTFLRSYAPAVERTGRVVLGFAALNLLLAAAMAAIGAGTLRRLTREGTDAPPRITWRSGLR
jgi:hypothetical protein